MRSYENSSDLDDGGSLAQLYVAPIPKTTTRKDVYDLFAQHGNVVEVVFPQDNDIGCCFVNYALHKDAYIAVASLNDRYTFPEGLAPIKVKYAQREHQYLDKLFVGCLNKDATEEEILKICCPNLQPPQRTNPEALPPVVARQFHSIEEKLDYMLTEESDWFHSIEEFIIVIMIQKLDYLLTEESDSSEESACDDDDDDELMGVPFYQSYLLNELEHTYFDARAKMCLQDYNDMKNASYAFVELVAVSSQFLPVEYYYTFRAKSSDGSLETFQAKTSLLPGQRGMVKMEECKISDVPYLSDSQIPSGLPLGKAEVVKGMKLILRLFEILPKAIVQKHANILPSKASLKLPTGDKWPVILEKQDDKMWFGAGWPEFASLYSIEQGSITEKLRKPTISFFYNENGCSLHLQTLHGI
ncbi:hypothetical protein ACFE04_030501 [Oxalis oulophora]